MTKVILGFDHPVISFVDKLDNYINSNTGYILRDDALARSIKTRAVTKRFLRAATTLSNDRIEVRSRLIVERARTIVVDLEAEKAKPAYEQVAYNIDWPISQINYFTNKIEKVLENIAEEPQVLNVAYFIKESRGILDLRYGSIYKEARAYYANPSYENLKAIKKKYTLIIKRSYFEKPERNRQLSIMRDKFLELEVKNML